MARARLIGILFAVLVLCPVRARAQLLRMGSIGGSFNGGKVTGEGVETFIVMGPANLDGLLERVSFGWSNSPCPAAVKIKVFRPSPKPFRWIPFPPNLDFVAERGPFDVTEPVNPSPLVPVAAQSVDLSPPLSVEAGDVLAISNLTLCGRPIYWGNPPLGFGAPPNTTLAVAGDVMTSVSTSMLAQREAPLYLHGSGETSALGLTLNTGCRSGDSRVFCGLDRFAISLIATDPRTGATALGVPHALDIGSGYFSLPEFTGQQFFPEVTVKIVDATGTPALGGNYWFFHAPLTDVSYTLTVKDQWRGTVRTYSRLTGGPGQLCGEADTNAFGR